MKTNALTLAEVEAARTRLAGCVRRTPCHPVPMIGASLGMRIWVKRDDLQRTGSFKERGARNALASLSAGERSQGVVAASAGNHALGLAFHGASLGVRVTVVMPEGAPAVKVSRCRGLGAEVVLRGRRFDEAQGYAQELARATGARYVHPFEDRRVIAGQGTVALEILEQAPQLDTVVVPVGGGGLLAGIATVVKALRPEVRVVAVEPENAACFLAACVRGEVCPAPLLPTLADGLAVERAGVATFALAAPLIDDVVTVSEAALRRAMALLAREAGIVAEGAGAAALAALLAGRVAGSAVVLPITGRNIDPRVHEAVLAATPESHSIAHPRAA